MAGGRRLWVWIPRTGGTSLHTRLASRGQDILIREPYSAAKPVITQYPLDGGPILACHHYQPRELVKRDFVPRSLFERSRPFIIIRNPWDRYASIWRFLRERCDWPPSCEWVALAVAGKAHRKRLRFDFTRPQHEWWQWADGTEVGDVIRLERMEDDLPVDLERLRNLSHLNSTQGGSSAELYDDHAASLVAEHDAPTIERGQYHFGGEP